METQHHQSIQRFAEVIDLQNRINLVVLGDSHAANIFDYLSQAGICHRFNLHGLPLVGTPVKRLEHPALIQELKKHLKQLKADLVFCCFGGSDIDFKSQVNPDPQTALLDAADSYCRFLKTIADEFALVLAYPFPPCTKDDARQSLYVRGLSMGIADKLKVQIMAQKFPIQTLQERTNNAKLFNLKLKEVIAPDLAGCIDVWEGKHGLIDPNTGVLNAGMQRDDDHHICSKYTSPALSQSMPWLMSDPVWSKEQSDEYWSGFSFDVSALGKTLFKHRKQFIPWQDHLCPKQWNTYAIRTTVPSTLDTEAYDYLDLLCPELNDLRDHLLKLHPQILNIFISHMLPLTTTPIHSGYSDISRHVLRCHLPVYLPEKNQSGITLNGSSHFHTLGQFLTFDDTYPHQGFNRSTSHDRIVVIVDIPRPTSSLPYSNKLIPMDQATSEQLHHEMKSRPCRRLSLR